MDAALGLRRNGKYTLGVRSLMVLAGAVWAPSYKAASELLLETAGIEVDQSKIEREIVEAGEEALAGQPARDARYARPEAVGEVLAERAHETLVCTVDGTMYLEQEGRRGPKPKTIAASAAVVEIVPEPPVRTPPPAGPESPAEPARAIEAGEHNPKAAKRPRTHGREVKVALVYGLDERTKTADGRPVLLDRRVAASTMGIEQFADRLKALVCRWGWRQAKRIAVIGDGAAWIWAWTALHLGEAAFQILDFWHARERLVELGNTLHGPHTEEARTFAKERADRLRNGEAAAVIEDLLESAKKRRGKAREAILAVATYFQNNRARMNYREYERLGLPIGSGSVESLGKSLVQRRMRGPGMRWEPDGAAAVVALRELHANADLDAFWQGDRERRLAAA